MFKLIIIAALSVAPIMVGSAFADDIEGMWKRPNGVLVNIHKCGSEFCVVAASSSHKGESAGKMAASGGGKYGGSLIDLENGKTYAGKASISGDNLAMAGCVLGGLFCKSEDWKRQ